MIDTNSVMNDARCVESCIPVGFQLPVLISIFANLADMSLDPSTLINDARCVQTCVPPGMQLPVLISLAQQIVDNGGGGPSGSGGNANLIPDGTDPNGTETALQGIRYDSLGNFWAKTNNVNNATGWEKFISAESEMAPAAMMARVASITVPAATLPETPTLPPVVIPESRKGAFRRFLEATKALLMSFFSFLPLILFLCVLKPLPSAAIPPPLLYQFCTTNAPTVLTNIIKSLATNVTLNTGFWRTNAADGGITNWVGPVRVSGVTLDLGTAAVVGDGSISFFDQTSGDSYRVFSTFDHDLYIDDLSGIIILTSGAQIDLESPTVKVSSLTANRAVTTDVNQFLTSSSTTDTELGYVHGVTSALQAQIDGKAPAQSGTIVTQNNSFSLVLSNNLLIDAAHQLSLSNKVGVFLGPAANSGVYGVDLTNNATASSGNQEYSPFLHLAGNGWKTTATAASQPVEFAMGVVPVQGSANPSGILVLSNSINNAAFSELARFGSDGGFTNNGTVNINNSSGYSLVGPASGTFAIASGSAGANAIQLSGANILFNGTSAGSPNNNRHLYWRNQGMRLYDFDASTLLLSTDNTKANALDFSLNNLYGKGFTSMSNGYAFPSNSFPITTYASIGNNGLQTWNSNGFIIYSIGTNAITGAGYTNVLSSVVQDFPAPTAITFPASDTPWTNNTGRKIEVYIDNTAITGTAIKKNGSQILAGLIQGYTLILKPKEYFSETFTVGTPVATYSPID